MQRSERKPQAAHAVAHHPLSSALPPCDPQWDVAAGMSTAAMVIPQVC